METASIFNAFFALIFVLTLIGLTSLMLKYLGGERFIRKSLAKSREKRLKLSDYLVIDAKRKLLLVKRDDVEHLILISADKETVIESNIKKSSRKK